MKLLEHSGVVRGLARTVLGGLEENYLFIGSPLSPYETRTYRDVACRFSYRRWFSFIEKLATPDTP